MLNKLITQTYVEYNLEYGRLKDSWTKWNFESFNNNNNLIDRLSFLYKNLESGMLIKVYGKDMHDRSWSKVVHCPVLKRIK
jgi:hypothetical protein